MSKRNLFYLAVCFLVCLSGAVRTQAQTPLATRVRPLTVTANVTDEQVRFAALTDVAQLRLEVFSAAGTKLYDSEFKFGNMLDWDLRDQHRQLLGDGVYQCVVTARDYAGRLIERRGQVVMQGGQASLQTPEQAENALQPPNPLSALERPDFLALLAKEAGLGQTLLAHDGKEGRLVSGSGGLSFRTGNFFAGKDEEQMRLTADGNLGIGVRAPQARLDVAGLIRTSEGIQFPDGSVQTTALAGVVPTADMLRVASKTQNTLAPNAPTVTINSLAKFVGPNTIDDSTIFDVGGNIGVGTTTPGGVFDLQRSSSSDILQRFWNTGSGGAKLRYVSQTGASAQVQLTDLAEWLSAIAGNNVIGLQFRVRDPGSPNNEAALDASARLTISRNGNVGIGTTTPAFPLSVAGVIQSTSGGFRFPDGTVQTTAAGGGGGVTSLNGLTGAVTLAAGTNVTITPAGNTLTIAATGGGGGVNSVTASAPLASSGGANPNISLTGAVPIANGGTGGTTGAILNSAALQTANFNISGNGFIGGNVGIGTTAPGFKLEVVHSGSNGARIRSTAGFSTVDIDAFNGDAALRFFKNGTGSWLLRNDPSTDDFEVFELAAGARIHVRNTTGNVGIGTTTPPDRLSVAVTGTPAAGISLTNGTIKLDSRIGSTFAAIGTSTLHPLNFYTNNGGAQLQVLTNGNVAVTNTLSKGAGSFKIDHPLDPENKYLYHSFVESPDMMNIYNGNVTTDENGLAEVALPDWFETLNRDFRYQLTVIGQFAQAIVAEKVKGNHFKIRTSIPNVEVSWQITGIRHDPYANANRILIEEDKPKEERGTYLHAEAYGQPEKSLHKKNVPREQQ